MRKYLTTLLLILVSPGLFATTIIPPALHRGDEVALISSGFRVDNTRTYREAVNRLHRLGLNIFLEH